MQTRFTPAQLAADPDLAVSAGALRNCVHCGFCTATCPTYVLLGDELDSPRGRIALIKDMLESGRPASELEARHIDRCLSCLSCTTTCPSGVDYRHLIDHARAHVARTWRRPFDDRAVRWVLARLLPHPGRFRLALRLAGVGRLFRSWFHGSRLDERIVAMIDLAPRSLPPPDPARRPRVFRAEGQLRARVALLAGCAQQAVAPQVNAATIRLLTRLGVEVVVVEGVGCCGALVHHMGDPEGAKRAARANVAAWTRELRAEGGQGLDAIVVNASGCGTEVKDYGHLLRAEPAWATKAARIAGLARDVTEFLAGFGIVQAEEERGITVAYHAACSLQHGQKVTRAPRQLLERAGFTVREPAEGHLCCGSAGVYNVLEPEIARALRQRKLERLKATGAAVVAMGNAGCMTQLAGCDLPVVHTVELLDWATGGPKPEALA